MSCQLCCQVAQQKICTRCWWGGIRIIRRPDITKKYKLRRSEIDDIQSLDHNEESYNIFVVWAYCDEKYKNLSDDDEKKIDYIETKKEDNNKIRDDDRHYEFMKIIEGKLRPFYNYRKWKLYKDYINGFLSKDDVTNNVELEIEIQNRKKNILNYVKTLSSRYRRNILKNRQVQYDYIKGNRITLETTKQILFNLEGNLINNEKHKN